MLTNPKISVIMSVFNAQTYLKEALDSILNQTFSDFEFLLIDDCSTDKSSEILEAYAKKDDRIGLIKNGSNQGLTKNLNTLINIACGEYIARMDADDISQAERFKKQVEFLDNNPNIDIVGTFSEDISEDGKILGTRKVPVTNDEIIKLLPTLNPLSHPTVMYRRESIEKLDGYDEKYRTSQDYLLWFEAAGHGMMFYNIPEFLFKYRMNDKYTARKSFQYRMNEFRIKIRGYKYIHHPWYKYHMAFLSLILAFIPPFLFKFFKRFDPR